MSNPGISVLMLSFNHEKYIRESLDSVLCQKTDIPFEIIIYDDCSTDGSRDVILDYQSRYPNLVKTIFPDENQYSKGKSPIAEYLIPSAKGEYVALLECDDYWTDANKLQRQFEYLSSHSDCAMCAHSVEIFDDGRQSVIGRVNEYDAPRLFSLSDFVERGGGALQTCSFFCRNSYLQDYISWRPDKCPVEDWPIMLYMATRGNVVCIPEAMGRYRVNNVSSWTGERLENKEHAAIIDRKIIEMLTSLSILLPASVFDGIERKKYTLAYDYAFRKGISPKDAFHELNVSASSLSNGMRVKLSIALIAKTVLHKLRLQGLIDSALLLVSSK